MYGDSELYAGHPGIYRFRALGSYQFSLEQSLANYMHRRSMGVPEKTHSLLLLIGYGRWLFAQEKEHAMKWKIFSAQVCFLINLFTFYIFVHHKVKPNEG